MKVAVVFALSLGALSIANALTGSVVFKSSSGRHAGCKGDCKVIAERLGREDKDSFASRPAPSSFAERLQEVIRAASNNPCNADIVATSYDRQYGFGSRMNGFANELLVALYGGYSVSLCDQDDHFIEKIWSPYFENVAAFPICKSQKISCSYGNGWDTFHVGKNLMKGLTRIDPKYSDELKHFIFPYIFKLNLETQKHIDASLSSIGLKKGKPYLALHIRRGDKVANKAAKFHESHIYADAARPYINFRKRVASIVPVMLNQLRAHKINLVYVASDDANATGEIRHALGGGVRVVEQPRLADDGSYQSRVYERDDELMMSVLTDVEALRRAAVFIGTCTSNFGRLVYNLRDLGSPSISLDADWQHASG